MILETTISSYGQFKVEYEEHDGYVVAIDNIRQMKDGEVLRVVENPSRRLYSSLVDAIQNELDKL